jgi:glucosamine--fructose-6-phosphate aminotransferase (isomerizing)
MAAQIEKGAFPHYMLKEIFEQPQGLRDTILPRVVLGRSRGQAGGYSYPADQIRTLRRINIVGSGPAAMPAWLDST